MKQGRKEKVGLINRLKEDIFISSPSHGCAGFNTGGENATTHF